MDAENPVSDFYLYVNPSIISFSADDTQESVVKIKTNTSEWTYVAPDWVQVQRRDDILKISASLNSMTDPRSGVIEFFVHQKKCAQVEVKQAAAKETEPELMAARLVMNPAKKSVVIEKNAETVSIQFYVEMDEVSEKDQHFQLVYDQEYVDLYNQMENAAFISFPSENVRFDKKEVVILAGNRKSEEVELLLSGKELDASKRYLASICVVPEKGYVLRDSDKRVSFKVFKPDEGNRSIKNVLYFEVNDTNPLNALEYVLEDGTPFFDAVILFASNISYDKGRDKVYLFNNGNLHKLLSASEEFIQPLRDKGIKVYLGILGNHDAAGSCQLSDWGAVQFAEYVADVCNKYRLDGVNLDDEYSGSPLLNNKWFAKRSQAAGDRLCYELKKALTGHCAWPTEVSYFQWGCLKECGNVKDLETGKEYSPKEFIDFYVANYGGTAYPYGGLTRKNCSAMSYELNLKRGYCKEEDARQFKQDGYGYVMWFAFNPVPSSRGCNFDRSMECFRNAAKGMYEMELRDPVGYYKKDYTNRIAFDSMK